VIAAIVINSADTFLEFSAALLFGIFTLRQFLLPDGVNAYTTIDYALLGLYLLLGISVLMHFFARRKVTTEITSPSEQISNLSDLKNGHNAPSKSLSIFITIVIILFFALIKRFFRL
jgi:hypothetical protein